MLSGGLVVDARRCAGPAPRCCPACSVSDRAEDTAYGAALIGAFAADSGDHGPVTDLVTFARELTSRPLSKGCSGVNRTHDHQAQTLTCTTSPRPDGTFAVVAMDQRNTLKRMYAAVGQPTTRPTTSWSTFKADVLAALAPRQRVPARPDATASRRWTRLDRRRTPRLGVLVAAEPAERGSYGGEPRGHPRPGAGRGVGARRRAATR